MADPDAAEHQEAEAQRWRRAPEAERERAHEPDGRAPSAAEALASAIGNRGFGQVLARMGEGGGILGDGTVHPDVQAAIAVAAGSGSRLDRRTLGEFRPTHGDLGDVRVHTGPRADTLARSVDAVAFTVGADVFFRQGAYDPQSHHGKELLAHELAHVVQQRGAPAAGPLKVTNPGDALERDADAVARDAVA
jgi:hypothetical protein